MYAFFSIFYQPTVKRKKGIGHKTSLIERGFLHCNAWCDIFVQQKQYDEILLYCLP